MSLLKHIILSVLIFPAFSALAIIEDQSSIHHYFNANLLKEEERISSVYGNLRYGLTENWEIGTQSSLLLGNIANVSLKHRMFRQTEFSTAFTSHSLLLPGTEEMSSVFVSLYGIVTDYYLNDSIALTGGLLDLFAWGRNPNNQGLEFHCLSHTLGADIRLSSQWSLSLIGVLPTWGYMEALFNEADTYFHLDYYRGSKAFAAYPGFAFISITRSWESLNLELGTWYFNPLKRPLPYINIFWKWI